MSVEERHDLTLMLGEVRAGVPDARDRLVRAVYDELVRIAQRTMRREPAPRPHAGRGWPGARGGGVSAAQRRPGAICRRESASRGGGPGDAARCWSIMPCVRNAGKRPGQRQRVPLSEAPAGFQERGYDVIDLRHALDRLAEPNPRQAQVVRLRFFDRMSIPEVAAALGVSHATVETDWKFARAWLRLQLGGSES